MSDKFLDNKQLTKQKAYKLDDNTMIIVEITCFFTPKNNGKYFEVNTQMYNYYIDRVNNKLNIIEVVEDYINILDIIDGYQVNDSMSEVIPFIRFEESQDNQNYLIRKFKDLKDDSIHERFKEIVNNTPAFL